LQAPAGLLQHKLIWFYCTWNYICNKMKKIFYCSIYFILLQVWFQICSKINVAIKYKKIILLQHLFYFIAHEPTSWANQLDKIFVRCCNAIKLSVIYQVIRAVFWSSNDAVAFFKPAWCLFFSRGASFSCYISLPADNSNGACNHPLDFDSCNSVMTCSISKTNSLICDHFRALTSAQLEMRRASQLSVTSNDYFEYR